MGPTSKEREGKSKDEYNNDDINRIVFGIIDVLPLSGPCPLRTAKNLTYGYKTYHLREVAPMENH